MRVERQEAVVTDLRDLGDAPLLERLAARSTELSRAERKVADVVLENPTFAMDATMAAVADTAGVSEPTVMRFCLSMGYDGFQSFKLALAQSLALGFPATFASISATDDVGQLSHKIFDHTISSLDRARRSLDETELDKAVGAILQADRINFAGVGASALVAMDGEQRAPLFGLPATAAPDAHQQLMAAAMATPETVTIIISNTGRVRSMIEIARTARSNGSTVIGISGEDTPLLQHCDVHLIVRTFEDTDFFTPTVSRIAGLVVIDILAMAVALRRGDAHAQRLSGMKQQLATYRRSIG